MDCKKTNRYVWATLVLGSGLALTPLSGADRAVAADSAPSATERVIAEKLDGTLEPDDIPGFANSGDILLLHAPLEESGDFTDLDPGRPVFIRTKVEDDGTLDDADRDMIERNRFREYADGVTKTELPVRYRFDINSNWDGVTQVQHTEAIRPADADDTGRNVGADLADGMLALKEQVRTTLTNNAKRGISMASNTPGDLMIMAQAYGAEAMVFQPSNEPVRRGEAAKGNYIYTIGSLCWNYACGGKALLRTSGNKVVARLGSGYQNKPSQFLALLAMSNILDDYEMKVDGMSYTIANLVDSEKSACRANANMALTLVGLAFYTHAKDQWRNDRHEMWSIEKMVASELNRPIDQGCSDATDWLLGLTSAVQLYAEDGVRFTPTIALAKKQILTYHEFVLSIQNEQGLWHPNFFLYKGTSDDLYGTLYASGHILRFLAYSLSDRELADPKIRKAVQSLAVKINQVPPTANAVTLTDRQLEALSVSLHALAIYNERAFR